MKTSIHGVFSRTSLSLSCLYERSIQISVTLQTVICDLLYRRYFFPYISLDKR